jgi:hypothetical protein
MLEPEVLVQETVLAEGLASMHHSLTEIVVEFVDVSFALPELFLLLLDRIEKLLPVLLLLGLLCFQLGFLGFLLPRFLGSCLALVLVAMTEPGLGC